MAPTRALGLAAASLMLALAPAASASAGGKRAHVYKPAATSRHAVTFHVGGVNAGNVLHAALVRGGHTRRRLDQDRSQRIARRGTLRVRVRGEGRRMARIVSHASARRARLWVRKRARDSVRLRLVTEQPAEPTDREPAATPEVEQTPVADALLF